ncbi:MAG: hypothetical protein ACREDP_08215 [Bradyrhizobium sp.]
MKTNAHRGLFASAALFNWLAGLPLLLAPNFSTGLLGLPPLNATGMLFMQITAGVVVAFGVAYWVVSRDPVRYRPYINLGLGLKVFLAGLVYVYWFSRQIPWPLPALATFDFVFAWFFWRYLRAHPIIGASSS